MGGFSPEQLPVLSTLAARVRRLRRLVRGCSVADLLQPVLLPRVDVARLRDEQARRRLRQVARRPAGTHDLQPARGRGDLLEGLLRRAAARLAHRRACMRRRSRSTGAPSTSRTCRSSTRTRRTGKLPAYAFIEPRMVYNHNDFHPPFGVFRSSDVDGAEILDSAVSDVRAGEKLVAERLRRDQARARPPDGSNAVNTLLLITFDEHGGTLRPRRRHPPPRRRPPTPAPGEMGFTFDRLGCRVPAIAVSAYTRADTIIHDEMHHGSVIATLSRLHGLQAADPPRRRRERPVLGRQPRHSRAIRATWPTVHPMYVPANPQARISPCDPAASARTKTSR